MTDASLLPPTDLLSPDPHAGRVALRTWLRDWVRWLRGPAPNVRAALARLEAWLTALEGDPAARNRLAQAWQSGSAQGLDWATLLADEGIARRPEFWAEFGHRLRRRLLPVSPETTDASEWFGWVFDDPLDARWLAAVPARQVRRLAGLLAPADGQAALAATLWRPALLDALGVCVAHVVVAGFEPELRHRMSVSAQRGRAFHDLSRRLDALRDAWVTHGRDDPATRAALQALRSGLDECRRAAYTAYAHLDEHGISTAVVFRLRQLRERVLRAKRLLDALASPNEERAALHLLARLVRASHEARRIGPLVARTSQQLAQRVADRNAETGEHYISRNRAEYFAMLRRALGGGAVLGLTTWSKLALGALGLSAFWGGLLAGLNYAAWFVLIMLLHWTVATKQPAMTAPALAARLKHLHSREAVLRFVDEVAHLLRSQVAAIAGNLLAVIPAVLLLDAAARLWRDAPLIDGVKAEQILADHQLWGPTLLLAAGTGILLFVSSLIAGWSENAFVLYRLDSALAHHPAWKRWLGPTRARRWAAWLRANVSGLAANVSLGLLLGVVPALLGFFGVGFDVRHVTLVTGQITAAVASLGPDALLRVDVVSAALAALLVGPINLAVSFSLAFRLALKAQGINAVNRQRIQQALVHRWRKAPGSFLWPPAHEAPPRT
ncbi:MAG: recombinase [Tepidimonas sp.]|uniref:site-specific recombinase n=1 Tax=Tepidimonas sp. TaxID=2002775 RepID=UPI00259F02ED|nr:recombinase [Tepidimonas sp.]MDM7455838.1 recombinase [Tepidimonas sp.]